MRFVPFGMAALAAVVIALPAAGQQAAFAYAPSLAAEELEAIRKATEKYRDINAAFADGYINPPGNMCVDAPMEGLPRQLGAMGLHIFRPDLLGITAPEPRVDGVGTHTDFVQPGVLVYAPTPNGGWELAAIENLVWAKPWKKKGNTGAPAFHGNEYYYMHDNPETEADEAHGFEPHYELHWWLYNENPSGPFAPFNPNVSCEGAQIPAPSMPPGHH